MEQVNIGEFLLNKAIPAGMPTTHFAKNLGISRTHLYDIANGDRRLSPKIAKRLEPLTGISARDWLLMQIDSDLSRMEQRV